MGSSPSARPPWHDRLLEGALVACLVAAASTQRGIIRCRAWLGSQARSHGMIGLSGLGLLLAGRGVAGLS